MEAFNSSEKGVIVEKEETSERWLTPGQIVYLKPGSVAWKMIKVIDDDPFTTLLKKASRPYVVISKALANRKLNTIWLVPIKTCKSQGRDRIAEVSCNGPDRKIVYSVRKPNKFSGIEEETFYEIDFKFLFTAQIKDLEIRGNYVDKDVIRKVNDFIDWNLAFRNHQKEDD